MKAGGTSVDVLHFQKDSAEFPEDNNMFTLRMTSQVDYRMFTVEGTSAK